MKSLRFNLDALGMCASTLCMIHCLVFPLLLAALPMWKLAADEADHNVAGQLASATSSDLASTRSHMQCTDEECCATVSAEGGGRGDGGHVSCCSTPADFWIHVGLLAAVAPLGVVAWGVGYCQHRRMDVLGLGLVGVILLSGALLCGHHLLGGRGEQVLTVAGSICMVAAHLWNRRQCRCCRTPELSRLVEIESSASESQLVPLTRGGVS